VKLDDETRKRLAELGAIRDRSPHWLMRQAIDQFLDREERYEREKREDMAEWQDYLLTRKGIDGEKMEVWLEQLAQGKQAPCPE
jgi:predicted transcriptional regulator